jgi:Fic family protein
MQSLKILQTNLLNNFEKKVTGKVLQCLKQQTETALTLKDFKHYMLAGAVASSQIEGSTLDLNSFIKSKQNKTNKKEVAEIEDLLKAYQYAKDYPLTEKNMLHCHKILSDSFTNIIKKQKGKYRQTKVGISSWQGLVYLAVEPEKVQDEMTKLFEDIEILSNQNLSIKQILYYAAYLHFIFAKIHPFADGNGRVARLLEKWFLATQLGNTAWSLPAEKYYFDNRQNYYSGLNVGVNYYETLEQLQNILPFLILLPKAICYQPID